jgi:hypothetical protein
MTGAAVKDLLLGLGDGDSVVIDGSEWTSFEQHGFEVEDLRTGDVVRVRREEVMSSKTCEVFQ